MELKAKDKHGNVVPYHPHGKHWVDGTIAFDLPMQRLSELFNINQVCVCVCVASSMCVYGTPCGKSCGKSCVKSCVECVYVCVARPVSSPGLQWWHCLVLLYAPLRWACD